MSDVPANTPAFSSFFIGGYECTYALTKRGLRFDMLATTKHDAYCRLDYSLLKELGITTVREGLAWHQIDQGNNRYDFSRFEPMMRIAQEEGVQQLWDLNHFDYPPYLDPFGERFIEQFAEYSRRCIDVIRRYQSGTIYITPINEISFWAFVGADVGGWAPCVKNRGVEWKKHLVRACIASMDAIWSVDRDVRFIQVDPIFRRIPRWPVTPEKVASAEKFDDLRYQSCSMLCGQRFPELGGHERYLDILGANYYPYNQEWIIVDKATDTLKSVPMPWSSPHRLSLAAMLSEVHQLYGRPMVISETGSWGALRAPWWRRTLRQIDEALDTGLPLCGVCAYPIVDRPDWTDHHLTNSGLWDFEATDPECERVPHAPTITIVRNYIARRIQNSPKDVGGTS